MQVSRRNFIKAGALTAAGVASMAALSGCATEKAEENPSWMPTAWDAEADIIVVGMGFAGLSAGIAAADEGLGSVMVLEAAPEEYAGGNSRVCGQLCFIPKDAEAAVKYQNALNGPYAVDESLMQAWAENLVENYDWLTGLGADLKETPICNPEFPDIEGSEGCVTYYHEGVMGTGHLWEFLMETAADVECPLEYNARAVKLVFDPETKEVRGLQTEDGRFFKANKGVILACGGFENNPDMLKTYYTIGYPDLIATGTPYNRGDGITMAQTVGADFWHMNNFSMAYLAVQAGKDGATGTYPAWTTKDYIYVGPNGKRYMYEETGSLVKHGKTMRDGVYVSAHNPTPNHAIFGSKSFEAGPLFGVDLPYNWPDQVAGYHGADNQACLDAGVIVKGETVRELAEKIGLDPDALEKTVSDYNGYCAAGVDPDYGRGTDVIGNFGGMTSGKSDNEGVVAVEGFALEPLEAPFYAVRQFQGVLNSQGGPKRSALGEVLDTKGNPIPRLYSAGELGCVYSYQYNGGGNVSEAISSGRLAARSCGALEAWGQE